MPNAICGKRKAATKVTPTAEAKKYEQWIEVVLAAEEDS
jgi:hypothetical protein